jgi:hypothetical protein
MCAFIASSAKEKTAKTNDLTKVPSVGFKTALYRNGEKDEELFQGMERTLQETKKTQWQERTSFECPLLAPEKKKARDLVPKIISANAIPALLFATGYR